MRRDASLLVVGLLFGLTSLCAAGTAAAIGIGPVTLSSWLGEPLRASFPLYLDRDEQLAQVEVGLGEAADYERFGLAYEGRLPRLSFEPVATGEGHRVLVRSVEAVREPVLDLVVEVHSPEGRILRSFTLLIDPPPAVTKPSAVTESPAPPADAVTVRPGDTLGGIARRLAPRFGLGASAMQQALFEANPQAFAGGSPDRLLAGARLRLPGNEGAAPMPVAQSAPAPAGVTRPQEAAAPAGSTGPQEAPAVEAAEAGPPRLVLGAPGETEAVGQMLRLLERARTLNAQAAAENERLRRRVAAAERELVAATERVLAQVEGVLARAGERRPSAVPAAAPRPSAPTITPAVVTRAVPPPGEGGIGPRAAVWWIALAALLVGLAAWVVVRRRRARQVADWRPLEWQHR